MLEKCFVSNSRLDHYQGELQRTLRDTAPSFLNNAIDITPEDREQLVVSRTGDQKGRVVLVTGSVGCGKTTLVHKVLVEARQDKKLVVLVVDLINEVRTNEVVSQLWNYIERQWKKAEPDSLTYDELRKIFGRELAQLRHGPRAKLFERDESEYEREEASLLERLRNDPEQFFNKCWRHYRQKHKGIVVFFDNVDRASQEYQEEVYAFAHKLALQTGITVVVTMREFTYFRGQSAGFLDVRANDTVFHLQAPNLVQVLAKRIRYIEDDIDDDKRLPAWRSQGDWQSFREAALSHADTLKSTFLKDHEGQERLSVLESVAWHNVRYFLSILGQLHVKLGDGYAPWSHAEIIAALLTPSTRGVTPTVITNIFRPVFSNYQCYYLKLRILMLMVYGQPEYVTRRGTYLTTVVRFMNLYGYHESWTKRSMTELVRERYLECLEAPAEEEYTKQYEIAGNHSFRPTPLSVVILEGIAQQAVYLSLIGNDLPFHTLTSVSRYEEALKELYKLLGSSMLEREVISIMLEADLGKVVAQYLVRMYEIERPPENLLNYVPELGALENKLEHLVRELKKHVDVLMPEPHTTRGKGLIQLPLFSNGEEPILSVGTIGNDLPIPERLKELRIDRSEQGPLILWALVALKQTGKEWVNGTEITEVINNYLVDDQHRKEPNNISRALRSNTLQAQPWLETRHLGPKKKLFRLSKKWKESWTALFGIPAPKVNEN